MINFLTGTAHHKTADVLTLLTGGVGYEIILAPNTLGKINSGDAVELHIHSHIREDAFSLFGFFTPEELALFKFLIAVSGVGPKTALLIIDRGVEPTRSAIVKADENFFISIPRLGKKNAQKIIIELKSKLGSLVDLDLTGNTSQENELLQALLSMGFTKSEAFTKIKSLPHDPLPLEEQIRFVLKQNKEE